MARCKRKNVGNHWVDTHEWVVYVDAYSGPMPGYWWCRKCHKWTYDGDMPYEISAIKRIYIVKRYNDNGPVFEVKWCDDWREAVKAAMELTKEHKQMHWVEEE